MFVAIVFLAVLFLSSVDVKYCIILELSESTVRDGFTSDISKNGKVSLFCGEYTLLNVKVNVVPPKDS